MFPIVQNDLTCKVFFAKQRSREIFTKELLNKTKYTALRLYNA